MTTSWLSAALSKTVAKRSQTSEAARRLPLEQFRIAARIAFAMLIKKRRVSALSQTGACLSEILFRERLPEITRSDCRDNFCVDFVNHVAVTRVSNRHLMRCRIPDTPPPLIINLRGSDVLVVQEFLDRFDGHAGIEQ